MKQRKAIGVLLAALVLSALVLGGLGLRREMTERRAARERQRALDAVEDYTGVLSADELGMLEQYRNLKSVDLRGSVCYDALARYSESHPAQEVRYTVPLGGQENDSKVTALTLEPDSFSFDELTEKLRCLPSLTLLTLSRTTLTAEEIASLRESFPERTIRYTVPLLGRELGEHTRTLDLSVLQPEQLDEAITALRLLPLLERVELTDAEGGNALDWDTVKKLQDAFPEICFSYRFELFGQLVSTEDERIEYVRVPIGNEGVNELRRALPLLKSCRYFLLDNCGIDNELLAQLRDEFPQTKIVWRLYIEYIGFLTDIKVLHLTWMWTNQNIQILRYCNELEYFDIGHNTISDISFMAYLPNLKYAILSYNYVRDVSPLANCKKLEMLELYFCHLLEDISPLAECESLKLLNVSATKVHDISPVFKLKNLERFYCIMNYGIPEEQQEQIYEELPDCWITFNQEIDKAVGWSFDAAGGVRAQWYLDMYKIFRYRAEPYFFGDYPEEFQKGE